MTKDRRQPQPLTRWEKCEKHSPLVIVPVLIAGTIAVISMVWDSSVEVRIVQSQNIDLKTAIKEQDADMKEVINSLRIDVRSLATVGQYTELSGRVSSLETLHRIPK